MLPNSYFINKNAKPNTILIDRFKLAFTADEETFRATFTFHQPRRFGKKSSTPYLKMIFIRCYSFLAQLFAEKGCLGYACMHNTCFERQPGESYFHKSFYILCLFLVSVRSFSRKSQARLCFPTTRFVCVLLYFLHIKTRATRTKLFKTFFITTKYFTIC